MPYLIALLLALAVFFFWQAGARRKDTGLPGGTIIYTDTGGWQPVSQALNDPVWDLTGKPDYLVRKGNTIIPVEVKTGRTPAAPYDSHIFQVAAYCLLVERVMQVRPSCGYIRYPNRTFQIDYTPDLEQDLKDLLDRIRTQMRSIPPDRSHHNPAKCRGCGFRDICDQRL